MESNSNVNFIFIGPDKSGSSWLFRVLSQHPEIFMTPSKDPGYFDDHYSKGIKWYQSLFDGGQGYKVVGEASHNYLFSIQAAERIAVDLPNAKMAVCLREPVDRAFSAYLYLLKHGLFQGSFEEAIDQIPALTGNGRYAYHLKRYFEYHDRSKILVTVFDDLGQDPQQFLNQYTEFMGVSKMKLTEEQRGKSLPASKSRFPLLSYALKRIAMLMRILGLVTLIGKLKSSKLVEKVLYRPMGTDEKPELGKETENKLRRFYLDDIQELDELLGTDLLNKWEYSSIKK